MPRTLLLAVVALATALTGPVGAAGPEAAPAAAAEAQVTTSQATTAPVATQTPAEPEVDELDLAGVDPQAVDDLPDQAPAPAEDATTTVPGATARSSAAPTEEAPAPDETTAAPGATDAPTAGPTETTEPSPGATPGVTAESLAPADPEEVVDPDVLTTEMDVAPFTVLGVSWDAADDLEGVVVRYRVRQDGQWSEWEAVAESDVAPDAGAQDATGTRGATDPVVAVDADGVQIWAQAEQGEVHGLKAVLIDPGEDTGTVAGASGTTGEATVSDAVYRGGSATVTTTAGAGLLAAASRPAIISRAQWGASASSVTCTPDYSKDVKAAAIHHTASSNSYAAGDVPGILRGILSYHTRAESAGGRGWCDIGYNFLVDRFGRVFEGRTGGVDRPVVGVHTGGFNSRTFGVSAIGEYGSAGAPAAMNEAISQLVAWKFQIHRITAGASVTLVSGGGSTKYAEGTAVSLPTIFGHRDTALTSCPGQNLYNALGSIRSRVAQLSNATVAASPRGSWDSVQVTSSTITVRGWALDPSDKTRSISVRVTVDGSSRTVTANKSRSDIAAAYPGAGDLHGFAAAMSVGSGRHAVCVTAIDVGAGTNVNLGCLWVRATNAAPRGVVDSVRVEGGDTIRIAGWAMDPDTSDPIRVHVYLDGKVMRGVTADRTRLDIERKYGNGAEHGFLTAIPATTGSHKLCVYALDSAGGKNTTLTCRKVTVTNAVPTGVVDSVRVEGGDTIRIAGWAMDPDTSDPIRVHVYLDGKVMRGVTADRTRLDIERKYGNGAEHGFLTAIPATTGEHRLCVYALDSAGGKHKTLTCRAVTV